MKIALLGHKGGTGKSTISVLLYLAARESGLDVTIVDHDPQGTASDALVALGDIAVVDAARVSAEIDVTIFDTPPQSESVASNTALNAVGADVHGIIVIPVTPNFPDLWQADRAADNCRTTLERLGHSETPIRFVVNQTRSRTLLTTAIDETLTGLSEPTIMARIPQRECFVHALAMGFGALDEPAKAAMLALYLEIHQVAHSV